MQANLTIFKKNKALGLPPSLGKQSCHHPDANGDKAQLQSAGSTTLLLSLQPRPLLSTSKHGDCSCCTGRSSHFLAHPVKKAPRRGSINLKGFQILKYLRPTETCGKSEDGKHKADKLCIPKSFYDSEGLH